jgi:hypothetical protein
MTEQLHLIDSADVSWRLDEQTKRVGRRGLAQARAALAAARQPRGATANQQHREDRQHAA